MGYSLLSKYRPQLMGAAMLWVMLFHASGLEPGAPILKLDTSKHADFSGCVNHLLKKSPGFTPMW